MATNVAMVGMGKLGLPVAYAMAAGGLEVHAIDPVVAGQPRRVAQEEGLREAIAKGGERLHFTTMHQAVKRSEVVFIAMQTPHDPRFEGTTRLPEARADFDYSYLKQAVEEVVSEGHDCTIAVISTVLPGTIAREIEPMIPSYVRLAYTPSFIAMGTTIQDFLDPEFALIGGDYEAAAAVCRVYEQLGIGPRVRRTIQEAELIKVAYNTFIGFKIVFANTLGELCEQLPDADVDQVTSALQMADRRLISGAYLKAGMGDGGACHPRDNIALSWLAREGAISYDIFDAIMRSRESQAEWLADLLAAMFYGYGLPVGILGTAYKPGSAIETGSHALLVRNILVERGITPQLHDPHAHATTTIADAGIWLIGCAHPEFRNLKLPAGSIVIDPFRDAIADQPGVKMIRLGRRREL